MRNKESVIDIRIDVSIEGKDHSAGILRYDTQGHTFMFSYTRSWTENPLFFRLQPDIDEHNRVYSDTLFPFVTDAMPDRWGRQLIDWYAGHSRLGRDTESTFKTYKSGDLLYLLGVEDELRMGALRFYLRGRNKRPLQPRYLSDTGIRRRHITLAQLAAAAYKFGEDDKETEEEISMLVAPGSSMGGSRPKAAVMYQDRLWLAKFSKKNDGWDVPAWEYVNLLMAKECGLSVPDTKLERLKTVFGSVSVLLTQRFDRGEGNNIRYPYMSALTLLGAADMERHGYMEILEALEAFSGMPETDKAELWKRIVFNIMITNIDDHLRNHGFLRKGSAFCLSPLFDLESSPVPGNTPLRRTGLYNGTDRDLSLEALREAAPFFGLSLPEADDFIVSCAGIVSGYAGYAKQCGLPSGEIDLMRNAYRPALDLQAN